MRGAVSDRPWGMTLGSLATRGVTGTLAVSTPDGKQHCIALLRGAVVGATSPLAADSVARIALVGHLVSSTDVPAIAREVAAAPSRDEIEVVTRIARLTADQAHALRRRVLVQRTARTFAIERGEYTFEDRIAMPVAPDIAIDMGAAIFLGARMNLSEPRLTADMRQIGLRFVLRRDAAVDLDRFGFTEDETPIVAALRSETSLVELDARFREIEPRTAAAIVYALVATDLCQATGGVQGVQPLAPAIPHAPLAPPLVPGAGAPDDFEPPRSRTITLEPLKSEQPQASSTATGEMPAVPRRITQRTLPPQPRVDLVQVRAIIAEVSEKIAANADHFALLGVGPEDSLDTVRSAFVRIVSVLHPEKVPVLPLAEAREAQRAFARARAAYAVLSDPQRRATYSAGLAQRGATPTTTPPPLRGRTATTSQPPATRPASPSQPPMAQAQAQAAEDAFRRGLVALRREDLVLAVAELTRAVASAPKDQNYPAYLAWAKFCAASTAEKPDVAVDSRKALQKAIYNSPKPEVAWFFLGRLERMMGRDKEAAHHFREVLALDPGHAEAAAELRFLEQRLALNSGTRRK